MSSAINQSGFTYLAMLFVIAIASVALAMIGINWSQASQREKEQELLFVGNQYRRAIALYYERTQGVVKSYPSSLEQLLNDDRFTPPQHYLRKLYRDPMTDQNWILKKSADGGIMGVSSSSNKAPIKRTNFGNSDIAFEGTTKYTEWLFDYVPKNRIPMNIVTPTEKR